MQNDTETYVVETETGKEVRMTYRKACQEYGIGFAAACFTGATLVAWTLLIGGSNLPEMLYRGSEFLFSAFSVIGIIALGIAYVAPVWFYEALEVDE